MKKLTAITLIIALLAPTTMASAATTAATTASVTIKSGPFLVDMPVASLGEEKEAGEYEINISDLNITDYTGVNSDYEIVIEFAVYDKQGSLKSGASLESAGTTLIANQDIYPDAESISLPGGSMQTIVANNFKTHFGEFNFSFKDVVAYGIEDGDQIEINFQLIN